MARDKSAYRGREPAYVKHYLLDQYLEKLIHTVAHGYDQICYIDGFAGPWKSASSSYDDTSFGIGLAALRKAKGSWKRLDGREIKMSAHLIEKSTKAFSDLSAIPRIYPDIDVRVHNGDFIELIEAVLSEVPKTAFCFVLIDPKGWKIPLAQLTPLLARPNTEVIFNFMFDFINRAASIDDQKIVDALDALLPHGGWRKDLTELEGDKSSKVSQARRDILVNAFAMNLQKVGDYKYVTDTPVFKPLYDRVLYSLVYATRSHIGLKKFRDCQVSTLTEQADFRASHKIAHKREETGQAELFESFSEMTSNDTAQLLINEAKAARQSVRDILSEAGEGMLFGDLWPIILERHIIRVEGENSIKSIIAEYRQSNNLLVEGWLPNQRRPKDNNLLRWAP